MNFNILKSKMIFILFFLHATTGQKNNKNKYTMDNKHIIEIIIKDAQEIESLTNSFTKFPHSKVPPIYIDLTISKIKNLYAEIQMLNKSVSELYELDLDTGIAPLQSKGKNIGQNLINKEPQETKDEEGVKSQANFQIGKAEEKQEDSDPQNTYERLHKKREEHFLATQLKFESIKSIKEAISLNEKIWFIKELFDGNIDLYKKTLDILNDREYLEEALDYIDDNFLWNYESQTVRDFMEFVYRRYY